jgi:hypothetical protein
VNKGLGRGLPSSPLPEVTIVNYKQRPQPWCENGLTIRGRSSFFMPTDLEAARVTSKSNEVYVLDVTHQNDATWRVLDSAVAQRDQATRLHGTAVALAVVFLPLVGSHYSDAAIVAIGLAIVVFLALVTYFSLLGVGALRLQQFLLSYAGGHASLLLEDPNRPRFFSMTKDAEGRVLIRIVRLRRQSDPMGLSVRSLLTLFVIDGAIATLLSAWLCVAYESSAGAVMLIAIIGTVACSGVTAFLSIRFWLATRRNEDELAESLAAKFNALGVPAAVDSQHGRAAT